MKRLILSIIVGAFAIVQSASVFANTLTVTSLADEFPAATPGTFRYALANSSEGDTIVFDDSIKGGTINMVGVADVTPNQDTSFVIAHALTIEGNGVTINGGWDHGVGNGNTTGTRIFLTAADQGKTTIKNLNLVNGRGAVWYGPKTAYLGGAVNAGSPLRLENCQLVNNCTMDWVESSYSYPDHRGGGAISAESDLEIVSCFFGTNSIPGGTTSYGGAIRQMGGSLTAENTVFECNYTKTYGGGVAYFGANVTGVSFKKCKFLESSAANGVNAGNIDSAMTGGYMKFFDCVFRGVGCSTQGGNVNRGGAINCLESVELTAVNCEFTGCLSSFGGAVYVVNEGAPSQPILFINCTFRGDHAATYGGAMEVFTPLYMVNCTVAGDYCSSSDGGGIYANDGIYLLNTVLAYNFCRPANPRSCDIADYQNPKTNLRSLFKGTSTASFGTTYTLATSPDDTTATKLFAAYESVSSMSGPLLPADFSSRGTVTIPAFVSPKLSNDDNFSRVVEIGEDSVLNAGGYLVRTNADCTYVEYSDDGGSTWKEFFKRDGASTDNLTQIAADQRGVPYKDGLPPIGAATVTPSCKHEHTTTNGYVAAQCEVAGDTGLVTCDDCHETLHDHEVIPPTGHLHTTTVGRVEPTCEATGWTGNVTCNDCHKTLTEGEEIPALGHDWDEGEITTPPTCTEAGEATFTCQREDCGATTTGAVDPLGHLWSEWVITKPPTPTEKGIRHRECLRQGCDYEENEEIDMHTIIVTTLADNFPAATPITGSLRAALAAAADGDVIMFDDSLAGGTITLPKSSIADGQSSFIVTKAVSIVAPEGGITIDGGHTPGTTGNDLSPRLFSVEKGIAGQVKFKGITFKRGFARYLGSSAYPGGACYVGSPTRFEDCVFTECELFPHYNFQAGEMGGALCAHADLELKGCKFDRCRSLVQAASAMGAALYAYGADAASAPNLTVEDCEFTGSDAQNWGGAVYLDGDLGDVKFTGCLFDGNTAVQHGGAISGGMVNGKTCSVICDGCSFRNNFASSAADAWGGAVSAMYGKWVFNRCEFSGNSTPYCGGALGMRSGAVEVRCINCTFVGNMTDHHGGACDFRNGNYYLVNCTFAANRIWNTGDNTPSMSIYMGGTVKFVNCLSVYCPNVNGWVSNSGAEQVSTGNFSGYNGSGTTAFNNCKHGDYTPITDLDNPDNVAAASKIFDTEYAYWVVPSSRYSGDTSPVTPANTKVVYPKLANDAKNPNAPRVLPILENGDLNICDGGWQVKVNDDFSHVCYSSNGGSTWTDLYKDTGADESTLTRITADQRGLRYKDGMIPIGAAGIAGEVVHSGLLIIVK